MAIPRSIESSMVLRSFLIGSALLLISACSEGEITEVKENAENSEVDGQLLYTNNCASCHGPDGNLGNSGSKDLSQSKFSEQEVLKIIKEGKGTMPPFEYLLTTDKEREAVMQFVMSLRKEEKNE
jgi:mono/diheme cytochrome c family protein